ncbi:hypothetical protein H4R33_006881, partial [Dimargaris cristalligena]
MPTEALHQMGNYLNNVDRFRFSITNNRFHQAAKSYPVIQSAGLLTQDLINGLVDTQKIQSLIPVQLADCVLLDSWFRYLKLTNDSMGRARRFHLYNRQRGKINSAEEVDNYRSKLAAILKPYRTNLETIENEWGYLRFNQELGPKERMVLFPLVENLVNQSADDIYQAMVNLAESTVDLETIYAALDIYKYEPIRTLTNEVRSLNGLEGQKILHNGVVQEPLRGIIAVMASQGKFTELMELAQKLGPLPTLSFGYPVKLIAHLLLKYGPDEYKPWAMGINPRVETNWWMGRLLGFENAASGPHQDQHPVHPVIDLMDSFYDASAFGHVHFNQDATGDHHLPPQLALRVHRPTAEKMLRLANLAVPAETQWFSPAETRE